MKNLKLLREEHGESQQALADELGISQSAIQQYEKGLRSERYKNALCGIADHYDVSVDFLLGRTEIRTALTDEDLRLAYQINHLRTPVMRECALKMIDEIERLLLKNRK